MDKPWYRHFWVWFVLAPLIATVLGSAATVYLAGGEPALVTGGSGPPAVAVDRDQRRDRRAAELGLRARLALGARGPDGRRSVRLRLEGAAPPAVRLELIHPTLESLDRAVLLERRGGEWVGRVPRADTRLYVLLADEAGEWRLAGTLQPGRDELELAAGRGP